MKLKNSIQSNSICERRSADWCRNAQIACGHLSAKKRFKLFTSKLKRFSRCSAAKTRPCNNLAKLHAPRTQSTFQQASRRLKCANFANKHSKLVCSFKIEKVPFSHFQPSNNIKHATFAFSFKPSSASINAACNARFSTQACHIALRTNNKALCE